MAALGLAALMPVAARAQTQDLFVSNENADTISQFAGTGPGTFSTTATTLSSGPNSNVNAPQGLAFDARGDLFAANFGNNSITEFALTGTGTFGAGKTVKSGLSGPTFIAFSPVPAVPEASTTVSLGLLLALGMGGVVVARKRRKA